MKAAVEQWIAASRSQLKTRPLDVEDLDRLEELLTEPRQQILYLTAASTNMRSGVVGWVLYDPTSVHAPSLPVNEPPYESVLAAVADGWRIVQFPISSLYEYNNFENDYIGFDFILEKWI